MDLPAKNAAAAALGKDRRASARASALADALHALRTRPASKRFLLSALAYLRSEIRAREIWLVIIAAVVGAGAGLMTMAVSSLAHLAQAWAYGIDFDERLSALYRLPLSRIAVLPLGGLLLGVVTWVWTRRRPRTPVDPVEANALHGGRMSVRESLLVGVQSVISNGFGASVGLEAAYAQLGAALASFTGGTLNLRRSDLRIFVGAGAGAGIAAAFGAPLTGAFYAFEIIIGAYTLGNIAPVIAAALAGRSVVTRLVNYQPLMIRVVATDSMRLMHYALFAVLGVICAFFGVAVMQLVALTERGVSRLPGLKTHSRPALGGILLGLLAWEAPPDAFGQKRPWGHAPGPRRDAGHPAVSCFLIATKAAASIAALGFGFRGGLFFASLYLGSLIGSALHRGHGRGRLRFRHRSDRRRSPGRHGGPGRGDHRRAAHHVVPGAGDHRRLRPDRGDAHRLDHRQPAGARDLRLLLLHLAPPSARGVDPQRP